MCNVQTFLSIRIDDKYNIDILLNRNNIIVSIQIVFYLLAMIAVYPQIGGKINAYNG